MRPLPACPSCQSQLTYEDGTQFVCPECGNEWAPGAVGAAEAVEQGLQVFDAHGARLQDGDSVTVLKDLKVRGSSAILKVGTKVKGIKLVEGDHNIDCRIDGVGSMGLKSEFVKKA
jgi:protein PhnA